MGKGLSALQRDILAVLDDFPALEQVIDSDSFKLWAKPSQILSALHRKSTASNRVSISKALDRLFERGLVARGMGMRMSAGKFRFYVRITDPKNAGTCFIPDTIWVLSPSKPKMKTVA
jgi:hypothetical protein